MSQCLETIRTRRSCRAFLPDPVPREVLEQIAAAGTWAPTGMGAQSPIILAITNRALRDQLSEMNAQIMGRPGTDPFYGAPAVLVVLADKSRPTRVYDGSTVMENLMLAAHELGVASCWIHRAKEEFESPEGKAILASLGIQGEYEGVGHCVLGYPAAPAKEPVPRKEGYVYWVE